MTSSSLKQGTTTDNKNLLGRTYPGRVSSVATKRMSPIVRRRLDRNSSTAANLRSNRDAPLSSPEEFPDFVCKHPDGVRGDEVAYALRGCRPDFPGLFSPGPKSLERVPDTADSWRFG